MNAQERKAALVLIWRHTHRDYKGTGADGARTVLANRGGTCLVELDGLTDSEIMERLPHINTLEAKRLARKEAA